jgi:hypothetical protein
MSETWLTNDEVVELTDKKRWSAQCRALAMMGVSFTPNAAGRPLVLRSEIIKTKPGKQKRREPDFSSLDKVA